jgi:hypothetical protein
VCVGVCNGEEIPRILLTARKEMKMIRGNTHTQQHVDIVKGSFMNSIAGVVPMHEREENFPFMFSTRGFLMVREKRGKSNSGSTWKNVSSLFLTYVFVATEHFTEFTICLKIISFFMPFRFCTFTLKTIHYSREYTN